MKTCQGRSLVAMFGDPFTKGKGLAYTVVSRGEKLGKAIRTHRWRYSERPDGEELYDLSADPDEQRNLAWSNRNPEVLKPMRSKLREIEKVASSKRRK